MRPRRTGRTWKSVAGVLLAGLLGGCALTAVPADDSRTAAVGRILDLETNHGFAIVEFPEGRRMSVHLGMRDLDKYTVGDDLRIDSYGRPLPPLPRSPRRSG
jgi:hypothetical protein